jgi:predicted dehydrogenase
MVESSVVPAAAGAKVVAALIGSGFMGSVHSRALRAAGIEMSGVLSSSSEKSKIAAQELGIQRAYKNLDELLEDEAVNLVHILTPNNTHAELISRALEAGKNIVCEKPLVTSSSEALSLTQTAAELGLVGAVPFVYRYHPMARQARYRVSKGDLGRILSIKGQYLQDWLLDQNETNWRVSEQAGGPSRAFADIGIHLCDLVEFVSGQKIVRLVSSLNTAYPSRAGNPVSTEDMVAVMAELEGGGLLSLMVSQVAAGHKNALSIELHGSSEALRFEQENSGLAAKTETGLRCVTRLYFRRTQEDLLTFPQVTPRVTSMPLPLSCEMSSRPLWAMIRRVCPDLLMELERLY